MYTYVPICMNVCGELFLPFLSGSCPITVSFSFLNINTTFYKDFHSYMH